MECSAARVSVIIIQVASSLRGFQKSFKQFHLCPTSFTPHASLINENRENLHSSPILSFIAVGPEPFCAMILKAPRVPSILPLTVMFILVPQSWKIFHLLWFLIQFLTLSTQTAHDCLQQRPDKSYISKSSAPKKHLRCLYIYAHLFDFLLFFKYSTIFWPFPYFEFVQSLPPLIIFYSSLFLCFSLFYYSASLCFVLA